VVSLIRRGRKYCMYMYASQSCPWMPDIMLSANKSQTVSRGVYIYNEYIYEDLMLCIASALPSQQGGKMGLERNAEASGSSI
jgi:hypothetical protein